MSKKQLQVDGIMNELEGASLFFKSASPTETTPPKQPETEPVPQPETAVAPKSQQSPPEPPKNLEMPGPDEKNLTAPYNEHQSMNAGTLDSMHASMQTRNKYDFIKTIRKTVKQVGKQELFIRVSPDEKHTLGSIVYAFNEMYRGEGYKTSENEVSRIGLNYLLNDYRENGQNSILSQVLAALIA